MKCLLVLASCVMLATAQYLNVDPSATNDYDLNRLISQVLTQAAAIQPEFTFDQQGNPTSQPAPQIQFASSTRNPEQFGPLEKQQDNNQIRDQYRASEQQQRQAIPELQQVASDQQQQRQIQDSLRPKIVRNEYVAPAPTQQTLQSEARKEYGIPNRQTQLRKEYTSQKNQVRIEYNNAPVRNNQRNGYSNEQATRQNPLFDELGLPEQQELKELTDFEPEERKSPSQRSSFSGRSQERGSYAAIANNRQSVRTNSVSNDLATASSSGYYRDTQRSIIPSGGYSDNLNVLRGGGPEGEIKKFVYIHTAPPEPFVPRARVQKIKAPAPETHYNIIFVKAPTPPREEPPEIELPSPPQTKTLVYVLLKKPAPAPEIRIPVPPPTAPSKPEVYFIRYADNKAVPVGDDQGQLPFDEEADLGPNNRLIQPTEFYGAPTNNEETVYNNNNNNNDFVENNVGAYSEPRKVSNSKKSSSKGKASQKSSHYTAPGSRPFEAPTQDSKFKPVNPKSGNRSRSQSQSSESGGY